MLSYNVHCSFVDTCWEKANLLALLYVMFFLCFCGDLGQVWYMIVSNPDLCRLPYFENMKISVFTQS